MREGAPAAPSAPALELGPTKPAAPGPGRRAPGPPPAAPARRVVRGGGAGTAAARAFLLMQAAQSGWAPLERLLFRSLTAHLLLNTVELALCVTTLCAMLGTAAAYATERTDLPLRRMWAALIVIPLAIPDFIVGYTWSSLWPALHGLPGAVLVMTLSLNPLVCLPAGRRGAARGRSGP